MAFYLIGVNKTLGGFSSTFITLYFPSYLKSVGITSKDQLLILSLSGAFSLLGRLCSGPALDFFKPNMVLTLTVVSSVLASMYPILIFYPTFFPALLSYCTLNASLAVMTTMDSLVLIEVLGLDTLAASLTLSSYFKYIGLSLAPLVIGALVEKTDNYSLALFVCGTSQLLAALAAFSC